MRFRRLEAEWDEDNVEHISRHGVEPEEVEEIVYEDCYPSWQGGKRAIVWPEELAPNQPRSSPPQARRGSLDTSAPAPPYCVCTTLHTVPRRKELIPIKATKPHPVIQRLPLTQARNTLGAVVKRVHLNKDYVILEKDGIPLAGVMDIDEFEDYLDLQDPKVRAHIAKSRQEFVAGKSRPAEGLREELRVRAEKKATRRRSA